MPQIFQVLRCFKCLMFQVHQTKKSNKFQCKMCGEKQSIKRHYGLGNGQECRIHVQKLNGIRGMDDENDDRIKNDSEDNVEEVENCEESEQNSIENTKQIKSSKWSTFIEHDPIETNESINETMYYNDTEVVLEIPKKCRKLRNKHGQEGNMHTSMKTPIMPNTETNTHVELNLENILDTYKENESLPFITEEKSSTFHQNTSKNTKETDKKRIKKVSNFIPPIPSKNSKWAQYTEDSTRHNEAVPCLKDHSSNICSIGTQEEVSDIKKVIHRNLFSLCEEDNLDSVLEL